MYLYGYGVEIDYVEALKWLNLSVQQNNRAAQNALGWMYYYGWGVEKDPDEAKKLFQKATNNYYQ